MAGEFDIMQSDHFGAIGGAKFVDDRIKSELDAQKTLGEIAAQPGKRELDAAHSRLYNAEAAAKEATAEESRKLQALLASGGQTDVASDSAPAPSARATKLGGFLLDKGLLGPGSKLLQAGATMAVKEQQVLTGEASQARQEAIAARSRADLVGRWASTITDEASLAQAVMLAQGDAELPPGVREALSQLPPDYASAKPKIDAFVKQGQTVAQAATLKATLARDKVNEKLAGARAGLAGALTTQAQSRTKVINQRYDRQVKEGGANDQTARDLKNAKIKSEKQLQEARDRKLYPLLSPEAVKDPAKRTLGQIYTLPNGSRMTWQGQGWLPAKMPAASPVAPDDGNDDEPDDDGDEE